MWSNLNLYIKEEEEVSVHNYYHNHLKMFLQGQKLEIGLTSRKRETSKLTRLFNFCFAKTSISIIILDNLTYKSLFQPSFVDTT